MTHRAIVSFELVEIKVR